MMKKRFLALLLSVAMVMNMGLTASGVALAESTDSPAEVVAQEDGSQTQVEEQPATTVESDAQEQPAADEQQPEAVSEDETQVDDTAATEEQPAEETSVDEQPMMMMAMAMDAPEALACSVTLDQSAYAVSDTAKATWVTTGGVSPYRYDYTWYITDENGTTTTESGSGTAATSSLNLTFGVSGHLSLQVTDAEGTVCTVDSTVFTISGGTPASSLICSIQLDKTSVANGSAINATWTASGGTAPYSYSLIWHSRTSAGVVTDVYEDTTATTSTFVPLSGTSGSVDLCVTDSVGRSAWFKSNSFTITNAPGPVTLTCGIALDKTTLSIGSTITATLTPNNGRAPYSYITCWEIKEADGNVIEVWGESATPKSTLAPLAGVSGKLKVTLNDAMGRTAQFESKEFAITGAQALEPLTCPITLNKATVAVGSAITGAWAASGGTSPYTYATTWVVTELNGETQTTYASGATGTSEFTPTLGSWGYLSVAVRDALGRTKTFQSDPFTVTGATQAQALACTITLSKQTVAVNNPVTATYAITGGTAPYTCSGNWILTETNGNEIPYSTGALTAGTSTFTPKAGVRGRLELEILDSMGRSLWVTSPQFAVTGSTVSTDPLVCIITLDRATLAVGTANKAKWSVTGGTTPYTYSTKWIITEANGNELEQINDCRTSSNEDSYLPVTGVKGYMRVTVYDGLGRTREFSSQEFTITDAVSSDPLACVFELDKTTVAVREAINATWAVSGGIAPYTVEATWFVNEKDGKGYTKAAGAAGGKASLIPFSGDSGYLSLYVKDSSGRERTFTSKEFAITGGEAADPLDCDITLDRDTVNVGTQIIANWKVTGGVEPYTFKAQWKSIEANGTVVADQTAVTDNFTGFAPKTGVTGIFELYVVDAVGHNEWFSSSPFAITGATVIAPMTGTIKLDKNVTAVRSGVTANWTLSGGKAPYVFTAQWQITESNGNTYYSTYVVPYTDVNPPTSTVYVPTAGAVGCLRLLVTDADGRKATLQTNYFSITGSLTATRLSFTATLDKTTVYQSTPITVTVTPSGGSSPYTYGYSWVTLDDIGYETVASSMPISYTNTNAFTPTAGKWGYVEVTLKDEAGRQEKWRSDYFHIDTAYAITSIKANKVSSFVGDPITWTVEARGFTTARQISYMVYNGDTLVAVEGFGTSNTYTYKPSAPGNYSLKVTVKEGAMSTTDDSDPLPVLAPLSITSVNPSATKASTGTMLMWVASVGGGSGTKLYQYRLMMGGRLLTTSDWVSQPTYTYTPMLAGSYTLNVSVRDTTATVSKTSPATAISVPLVVTGITGTPKIAVTGTILDWSIATNGGSGTKQYYCKVYLGNTVVNSPAWSTSPAYSYTVNAVGNYALSVTVRDDTATLVKASPVTRTYASLAVSSVMADATAVELGTTVTWTVNATGGDGAKTYQYKLMRGTTVVEQTDWLSASTYAYAPTATGTYTVTATVKAGGETVAKTSAGTEARTPDPLTLVSVTPSKTFASPGDTVTWTVVAEHGSGVKQYQYKLYNGGTVVDETGWLSDATYQKALANAGVYALRVTVKDSLTSLVKTSATTTVTNPLVVESVTASSGKSAVSAPITWTVSTTGGVGSKLYQYKLYKGATVVNTPAWVSQATFTYTPTEAGSYALSVTVKDSAASVSKTSAVTAVAASLSVTAVTPDTTYVLKDQPVNWTVAANCDNVQYLYKLYCGATVVNTPSWTSDATFTYTPDAVGSYALSVSARLVGMNASKVSPVTKVYVPLTLDTFTADKENAATGDKITWTATATGGEGTKYYQYKLYRGATVVETTAWLTANTYEYTAAVAGNYAVSLTVKDNTGNVRKTSKVTIVSEP